MRKTIEFGIVITLVAVLFAAMPVSASYTFTTYDDDRSSFDAAISGLHSTELDFDELDDKAEVTDHYSDMGVVFSALPVSAEWYGVSRYYPTARSGSGSLSASNPVSYPIGVGVPWDSATYSELYVEFGAGTSFMGAYFIDNSAPITVRIFDIDDNEIGFFIISGTSESGNSGEWWGVVANERAIARMTFTATSTGDFFAIDNFVFETVITSDIDIDPDTLNLKSNGQWITCYIELEEGYDVADIDISTILLNGIVSAESEPTEIGDYDGDGIPDLMVKFDRAEVMGTLGETIDYEEGIKFYDVTITVTGELTDGTLFKGEDTVKAICK